MSVVLRIGSGTTFGLTSLLFGFHEGWQKRHLICKKMGASISLSELVVERKRSRAA